MDLSFAEASSLAIIDRQMEGIITKIAPAQYEIVRQVIYATADLDYQSLLNFSPGALTKAAAALTAATPIIVDVPEIQVSIVPKLQKTFGNPVYCCATTKVEVKDKSTKIARGLETLAKKYPHSIFIIGQEQTAMTTMIDLLDNKRIEPSLAIATPPIFLESHQKPRLIKSSIPYICLNANKGGANVASAIFNSLIKLTGKSYLQEATKSKD